MYSYESECVCTCFCYVRVGGWNEGKELSGERRWVGDETEIG